MRPRISIRGCVRQAVCPSVRRSVGNAFVKIAENGVMQDEGASTAVYPALFLDSTIIPSAALYPRATLTLDCIGRRLA